MSLLNNTFAAAVAASFSFNSRPAVSLSTSATRKSSPPLRQRILEGGEQARLRSLSRSGPYRSAKRW